jgi:ABC-type multidrug transport system fused ATPase/permease subunit
LNFVFDSLSKATSCSLICALLGVAGLPSFLIVCVIIFASHRNGQLVGKIRRSAFPFTDKRLELIQELISAIKIVKIYCFEDSMSESVLSARNSEISTLKKSSFVSSLTATLVQGNAVLILLICLVL